MWTRKLRISFIWIAVSGNKGCIKTAIAVVFLVVGTYIIFTYFCILYMINMLCLWTPIVILFFTVARNTYLVLKIIDTFQGLPMCIYFFFNPLFLWDGSSSPSQDLNYNVCAIYTAKPFSLCLLKTYTLPFISRVSCDAVFDKRFKGVPHLSECTSDSGAELD